MPGEFLSRWSIRLALVCYAAALAAQLLSNNRPSVVARSPDRATLLHARPELLREARLAWTAGCALLWVHVAAAFHFYHNWSHTLAFEDTARQTEELLGFAVGEGVYVNYLFAAVWTIDAAYWWFAGLCSYAARPRWISVTVHAFLLFIVANATITFRTGASALDSYRRNHRTSDRALRRHFVSPSPLNCSAKNVLKPSAVRCEIATSRSSQPVKCATF